MSDGMSEEQAKALAAMPTERQKRDLLQLVRIMSEAAQSKVVSA